MKINLKLFDMNTNTTATNTLSAEMKTYYSDYLIDNAKPNLVHDQFGQKHPIPTNGGKSIEFRKFIPFSKATTPLSEGVTPDGGSLSVTNVTATVEQYGYYVTMSDVLMLTAIDNTLLETTKLLGSQAGSTLDTVTREVLNGGTSVMYAGEKEDRSALTADCKITVDDIFRAARFLKTQNAPKINGSYVAIIHPDVAYDLMRDDEWIDVHKYSATTELFEGEIGKLAGIRFVESTEAKIFHAQDLCKNSRNFTVSAYNALSSEGSVSDGKGEGSKYQVTVNENINADDISLIGRNIQIKTGNVYEIATICGFDSDSNCIYLSKQPTTNPTTSSVIYPGDSGADGRDVYSTLVLGANAYGVTEVTGGGLQHIVKQLGSGGTADPLNQRATAGWKGTKTAERLVENYMIRIESASTFQGGAN